MSRRKAVRLTGGETEAQRAGRLARIAWHGYAARVPVGPVGEVFLDAFEQGYAAALQDEVPLTEEG